MKTKTGHLILIICLLAIYTASGQTTYTYPLSSSFSSNQAGGPDLIVIQNNEGLTGAFTTREVPVSTCGQGGTAGGYFFEDDAGLQFNNPEGFIDQSYSLAMNFQVDEFISPPQWVRLLSFTHYDDIGIYIKLTNAPTNGTLEFWPYGLAGETNFFSPADFYQIILVRNDSKLIKIYVNGQEFAEYDDSGTQKFVPGPPDNFIVFFRDDPSELANEASPGFVSNIIIKNLAWSAQEVQEVWDNFCSSLLGVGENEEAALQIYPNPVTDGKLMIVPENPIQDGNIQIFDLTGKKVLEQNLDGYSFEIDVSSLRAGIYCAVILDKGLYQTVRLVVY